MNKTKLKPTKLTKTIILLTVIAMLVVADHFSTWVLPIDQTYSLSSASEKMIQLSLSQDSQVNQSNNLWEYRAFNHHEDGQSLFAMGMLCLPTVFAGSILYYLRHYRSRFYS